MKGQKITQGDKKKMVWLDMQHFPQYKIAQRVGCSRQSVTKHLEAMRKSGDYKRFKAELQGAEPVTFDDERPAPEPEPEPPKMKNTGVNPEFDAAVDEMIAEATEPDRLPKEIAKALMYRLRDIDEETEQRELRIAELKREIEALDNERAVIEKWREEHA